MYSIAVGQVIYCYRFTTLEHYLFKGKDGSMLLALGVGSLFNHSKHPNLDYRIDHNMLTINYSAARDISSGEELTIFYGTRLWFEDAACATQQDSALDISTLHEHMDDENTFMSHMLL